MVLKSLTPIHYDNVEIEGNNVSELRYLCKDINSISNFKKK